ncbi:hypothetical protein LUQ84_3414 [Hamiltosporidium tvaerminnensis]|nr:hypothetical protein LUQ84_3414 [Hamiltosporidium tvaerminnensis]
MYKMNTIDTENKRIRFSVGCALECSMYYLNIFMVSYIRFSVFAILFSKIHICRLNVKILEIDENKEFSSLQDYQDVHFLCMKTCTLLHSTQENCFKRYLTSYNSTNMFQFSYPNDIFLEFEFFNEKLIEKKEEVSIYIEKTDYRMFICFLKLLETNECTMKIEPVVFFEFLKYCNIFRVNRNNQYKIFIKSLVFHSIMFNEDYFARISAIFCLCHREYNNLHVRDVIECFFKFYLLSKKFIYELFHKYNPMVVSSRIRLYKKYKLVKNFISLQIEEFEFHFHNHLLNLKFYEIWKIMIRIFYIDKFYVDLVILSDDLNLDLVASSFPKNVKKASFLIYDDYLPLFDILNEINYFDLIQRLKLIFFCFTKHVVKILGFLKSLDKLTLILRKIKVDEIISLEKITSFQSIKIVKIKLFDHVDLESKTSINSFVGNLKNLKIDLSNKLMISDSKNELENFLSYNFYNYINGINLRLCRRSYILFDFEKIFNFDYITRLKLDFKRLKYKCLKNYKFLESFIFLNKLYILNVNLTIELLVILLRSEKLKFILFKSFEFDEKINSNDLEITNKSVIRIEFLDLKNFLNAHFFYFINRFMSLEHLLLNLIFISNTKRKNFGFEDKLINLNIYNLRKMCIIAQIESFRI